MLFRSNTKGLLPLTQDQKQAFKLDDKSLSQASRLRSLGENNGQEVYEVPAGTYRFAATLR